MFRARPPGRRVIAALAATLVALGTQGVAHAAPILFDPDGTGATTTPRIVDEFAAATGNALAINAQALLNAIRGPSGTGTGTTAPFFTVYQARIEAINPPNPPGGLPVFSPGINSSLLTVVAGFFETATTNGPTSVTFSSAGLNQAGSFLEIYAEPQGSAPANEETGLGFRDGNLVLRAVHVPGTLTGSFAVLPNPPVALDQAGGATEGPSNIDGLPTISGNGGTGLTFQVTDVASAYFPNVFVGQTLAFFSTTNAIPFNRTEPSDAFYTVADSGGALGINGRPTTAGTAPNRIPALGSINGGDGGPDVMFESRASFSFAVVPEPGSVVLAFTGLATVGLGSLRKLRRRTAVPAA